MAVRYDGDEFVLGLLGGESYDQGVEIITCGLAWGAGTGESLWRWLGDYYDYAVPRIPQWRTACTSTPPPLPWLGAVLTANLKLISHGQARLLGAVERDLDELGHRNAGR